MWVAAHRAAWSMENVYRLFPPPTCPLTAVARTNHIGRVTHVLWERTRGSSPPTGLLVEVARTNVSGYNSSLHSILCGICLIEDFNYQPAMTMTAIAMTTTNVVTCRYQFSMQQTVKKVYVCAGVTC